MPTAEEGQESSASSSARGAVVLEVDPLLKDLSEKKQSFRRNVLSLAAELKEVRGRLTSQEESFATETMTRQEAESKALNMGMEIDRLQKILEERNVQLQSSTSAAEMYVEELCDLKSQLSVTKASADASAVSARFAQSQCMALLKELEEKVCSLKEHEARVNAMGEQLKHLQMDFHAREFSQMLLKDEVARVERDILRALETTGIVKDSKLEKLLDEVCPKNFEKIDKLLSLKDEEISKLRDEIRVMSGQWKLKTGEMEFQLEKQHRADQELKKKVLKLEFCLQDARAQTRKLHRMGEHRDKAFKNLIDQLAAGKDSITQSSEKKNLWETSSFKIVASVSMFILVLFSRR